MDIEDIFKELNEKFDEYHDEARQCLFDGIDDILDTNSSGQDPSAHESRRDRLYSDECEFEWDPSPMHKDSESEDESISPNTKKKIARRKIVCSSEDESISNPPVADRRPPKRKSPLELEHEPETSRKSPPEQLAKSKFRSAICLLPFGCYTLFLIPCTPCLCID